MAKSDIATPTRPYETLAHNLRGQAELNSSISMTDDEKFELAATAIDRIASANSIDAIFDANEASTLPAAEDAAKKGPLTIIDVEFRKSSDKYAKGTLGVFAFIKSATDNGESFDWTTGAPNIVASMAKIQELGKLGETRVRIEGTQTNSGNTVYRVVRP